MGFVQIVSRWELVVLSTAAAYTIPWLVTRRTYCPSMISHIRVSISSYLTATV